MHPFLYFLVQQTISFSSRCTAKIPSPFPVRGSIFWIDFQPTRAGVAQRAGKIRCNVFYAIILCNQGRREFFVEQGGLKIRLLAYMRVREQTDFQTTQLYGKLTSPHKDKSYSEESCASNNLGIINRLPVTAMASCVLLAKPVFCRILRMWYFTLSFV